MRAPGVPAVSEVIDKVWLRDVLHRPDRARGQHRAERQVHGLRRRRKGRSASRRPRRVRRSSRKGGKGRERGREGRPVGIGRRRGPRRRPRPPRRDRPHVRGRHDLDEELGRRGQVDPFSRDLLARRSRRPRWIPSAGSSSTATRGTTPEDTRSTEGPSAAGKARVYALHLLEILLSTLWGGPVSPISAGLVLGPPPPAARRRPLALAPRLRARRVVSDQVRSSRSSTRARSARRSSRAGTAGERCRFSSRSATRSASSLAAVPRPRSSPSRSSRSS